jgi:CBS domain-containing protein
MNTIRELCRRELYSVRADQSVLEVTGYMAARNIGGVGVLESDAEGSAVLAGIFTERDLMTRVVAARLDASAVPVSAVMTANPVSVAPGETVDNCMRVMKQNNCRHLPVVDGRKLLAMISLRDLLEIEIAERAGEADMMRSYIHSVPPGAEL